MLTLPVTDWVNAFAPAGLFRVRCKLCRRELYGESRAKHACVVHAALLSTGLLVHTRGKWQMQGVLAGTQPKINRKHKPRVKR